MVRIVKPYLIAIIIGFQSLLLAQNDYVKIYQSAIKQAMYPATNTVDSSLIAITSGDTNLIWKSINNEMYLLVVTWKGGKYYPDSGAYNTSTWSPVWVTTAPELKTRMKKEKYKDQNLRLLQLLGLPPNATYSYFYEFWVKPSDLFRPCPDREITDKKCDICYTAKNAADSAYAKWINETRISRYYTCGLYNQYPWTELGYTYDWNPKNKKHIGLCEFVIKQNSNVFVNKFYTTSEYLK